MKINDRGAASVLVLLLIIVLATFGAIALTTGYANKNMVSRSAEYFKDYYEADAVCEAMVCRIDQILLKAHNDALAYIEQYYPDYGLPAGISPSDVPDSFRGLINYDNKNSTMQAKKVTELYRRLYFYYAYTGLCLDSADGGYGVKLSEKYASGFDFLNTYIEISKNECPVEIEFTGSGSVTVIDAKLGVTSSKISFVLDNSVNLRYNIRAVYGNGSSRYRILSWMQRVAAVQAGMQPIYDGKAD